MMRRFLFGVAFILYLLGQIKVGFFVSGCGYGNVTLDQPKSTASEESDDDTGEETTETSEDCEETGDAVTSGVITATISGDPCASPAPTASDSDMLLGCTERNTDDPDTNHTTLSCETNDGETTQDYFCLDGVVYKDDGAEGEELFATTTLSCDTETGLTEEEVIVSSINDF